MEAQIIEMIKAMGVAAPLVAIQFWLLHRCEIERKDIAAAFTADLQLQRSEFQRTMDKILDRNEVLNREFLGTLQRIADRQASSLPGSGIPPLDATDWRGR